MNEADSIVVAGEGLFLRRWVADDASALVRIFDDPEVAFRTPLPSPFGQLEAATYLEARPINCLDLAITTDCVRPVGQIMLNLDSHMVSYVVAAQSRGQGIATRALTLVARYSRDVLRIPTVGLEIESDNGASIAVARKCGFRPSGRVEEVEDKGRRYILETWLAN